MGTSITLEDDVWEVVAAYAAAREMTLDAAVGELIRNSVERPFSAIRISPNGIPILSSRVRPLTLELVKSIQDDEAC